MPDNNQRFEFTHPEESNDNISDNKCFQFIEQADTNIENKELNYKRLKKPDNCSVPLILDLL